MLLPVDANYDFILYGSYNSKWIVFNSGIPNDPGNNAIDCLLGIFYVAILC